MLRKLIGLLLTVAIVFCISVPVFANPETGGPEAAPSATPFAAPLADEADYEAAILEKVISDDMKETDEFYVDITRPEVEELSLTKSTYVVTGVVKSKDYTDVTVVLQVYDEESGTYIPLENTDGETQWKIGSFGVFSKEIKLREGPNQIRLLIYRSSQIESLTADDIQVDKFTITLLKSGVKEIFNKAVEITTEILKKIQLVK